MYFYVPLTPLLPVVNDRFNIQLQLCHAFPVLFISVKLYRSTLVYWRLFTTQSSTVASLTFWALLCHTPRVLFWHPLGLIVPFRFSPGFDTLWVFLRSTLYSYFSRWKQPFLLPTGTGREMLFCYFAQHLKLCFHSKHLSWQYCFEPLEGTNKRQFILLGSHGWNQLIVNYDERWSRCTSVIWVCSCTSRAIMLLNTLEKMKVVWWRAVSMFPW